jgi:hypothetical protein
MAFLAHGMAVLYAIMDEVRVFVSFIGKKKRCVTILSGKLRMYFTNDCNGHFP